MARGVGAWRRINLGGEGESHLRRQIDLGCERETYLGRQIDLESHWRFEDGEWICFRAEWQ